MHCQKSSTFIYLVTFLTSTMACSSLPPFSPNILSKILAQTSQRISCLFFILTNNKTLVKKSTNYNLLFTTSSSSTLEFILAPKPSNTSTCQPQSFFFRNFSFSLMKYFPIVYKSSSWHHQICQQFSFLIQIARWVYINKIKIVAIEIPYHATPNKTFNNIRIPKRKQKFLHKN